MAEIVLDHVVKRYPDGALAVDDFNLDDRRRRVHHPGRPVGLREVDHAEHGGRPGGHHRRQADHRRQRRQRQGAQGPRHRDGVPVLRALPAHDRRREHGLPAQARRGGQGHHPEEGQRGGRDAGADPAPRPQAVQPVRRPAPARRDGTGHRAPAQGVPDGRAAVQPRRQAARADAHPGVADPEEPGHHHALRHPRPDRGDDARRPGRGHAAAASCSRSVRRPTSTTTRSTCSSPASSAARR